MSLIILIVLKNIYSILKENTIFPYIKSIEKALIDT